MNSIIQGNVNAMNVIVNDETEQSIKRLKERYAQALESFMPIVILTCLNIIFRDGELVVNSTKNKRDDKTGKKTRSRKSDRKSKE
jgi:hypothetical protein